MLRRALRLLIVLALEGAGAWPMTGCADDTPSDPGPSLGGDDAGIGPQAFSEILTVQQIAVYQGVKVSLVSEAAVVTPNAPIVPHRPALVRMHAKIPPRTQTPKLTAELHVRVPGQPDIVLAIGPRALKTFDEGDLTSSFYWELGAEQVLEGAQLFVEIRDPSGIDPNVVRYPAESDLPMNVGSLAPTLKVTFVPIKYEADGSNRIPAMDAQVIDAYRDALYKMYPVSEVQITVRDVVAWPLEVRGDGGGWSALLDAVIETRDDDKVADDVYYVGVFTPNESQREYCGPVASSGLLRG
ncbi:MAG: hypothetical protein K0S65_989 [Labilithrix sp.]|nr:hypothetical protein [Labilithrix sp.]